MRRRGLTLLLVAMLLVATMSLPAGAGWDEFGDCVGPSIMWGGATASFFAICATMPATRGGTGAVCGLSIASWTGSTASLAYCLGRADQRRRDGSGNRFGDSDGDGTPDSQDDCPQDPWMVEPGACGGGVADRDEDGNGTVDCEDVCPAGVCL